MSKIKIGQIWSLKNNNFYYVAKANDPAYERALFSFHLLNSANSQTMSILYHSYETILDDGNGLWKLVSDV